jgi:hypothetical protein
MNPKPETHQIVTRLPYIKERVIFSVFLQFLLLALVKHQHKGTLVHILTILTSLLAVLPVALTPRWLGMKTLLLMRLLSCFPTFVLLAEVLRFAGCTAWWKWLVSLVGG